MDDNIKIAITDDASIRVYAGITTELVNKGFMFHKTMPTATAALGRLLTAGAIIGAMQKDEKVKITLRIDGDGPLGTLICVTDADSNIKGYVANPTADLPLKPNGKIDVGGGVGKGYLSVIYDHGRGEEPYAGQVELVSGEIAEDLTSYYATSEQTPTAIALGVLVDRDYKVSSAGGYLIQLMPGYGENDDKNLSIIEENIKNAEPVSKMVKDGKTTDEIIDIILKGIPHNILEERKCQYKCDCSEERVARALISIGKKDLESLINDNKPCEVECHFCDKKYVFSKEKLKELLQKATRE